MSASATEISGRRSVHPVIAALRRRVREGRIPVAGTFELTSRCNLRCAHCYLPRDVAGRPARELGTGEVIRLLDGAIAAGCLDVLLTGGEPLLRPDFGAIYRHARESGTFVTVFTNGTLLQPPHLALFRDLPPASVEVTVYGATRETYERVTGVPGSHARCLRGIHRLLDAGVRLTLKTVILRSNQHEVAAMTGLAARLGVDFRTDPVICPGVGGDPVPLAERVDPEMAAAIEFADERRHRLTAEFLARVTAVPKGDRIYQCDAGVVSFYVSATGHLRPCVMTTDMAHDAVALGFEGAWRAAAAAIGEPRWDPGARCRTCDDLSICGFCPALLRLETGSASRPSDYLCQLGRARRKVLEQPASRTAPEEEKHVQ